MSKKSARQKLIDLIADPQKPEKPIIICFEGQIPATVKSDQTVIAFRDFRKEQEIETNLP